MALRAVTSFPAVLPSFSLVWVTSRISSMISEREPQHGNRTE